MRISHSILYAFHLILYEVSKQIVMLSHIQLHYTKVKEKKKPIPPLYKVHIQVKSYIHMKIYNKIVI